MKYRSVKKFIQLILKSTLIIFGLFSTPISFAQKAQGIVKEAPAEILNFERREDILKIKSSDSGFEQSNIISVLGKNSLRWSWKQGAKIKLPLYNFYSEGMKISPFDKAQCLVVWIYNKKKSPGALNLTLTGENLETISSKFYLDYNGWRTAHIPLSQMEGKTPQMGDFNSYQWLELSVPEYHPEKDGCFFIDDVYTSMIDARHPSADY